MATIAVLERQETGHSPVAIPVAVRGGDVVVESFGSRDCLMQWARFAFGDEAFDEEESSKLPRLNDEPIIVIINSGVIDDTTIETLHDLKRLAPSANMPVIVISEKRDHSSSLRALEAGAMEVFARERGHDEWLFRLRKLLALCRRRSSKKIHQDREPSLYEVDKLTNFPSQAYFAEDVKRRLASGLHDTMALHIVRIDSFDVVNNAFNPGVSQKLLEVCANRLRNILGSDHIVGRFGADSFAVLQCCIGVSPDIEVLARQIQAQLCAPCLIAGHHISLEVTIGIACYPQHGLEYDVLSHHAGLGVNHVRNSNEGAVAFFHEDILADARRIASLDIDLRNALTTQQFFLQFQPQVDLISGQLSGVEALVRWRRTDGSIVSPGEFLPYAEMSGLIVAIDEWVLSEACRAARHWHNAGLNVRISVNLSSKQFAMRKIPDLISRVLQETGLDPIYLDIELTESSIMQDMERVRLDLARIRELGVTVSIDDFGVGYSSLHFLKQLRADRLKIDRGFIRNLASNQSDRAILRTIIDLGHQLGFGVVAEGVETAEQLAILREESCDEVQGFLFAQPMSTQDFMVYAQRIPFQSYSSDATLETGFREIA
ncbi:putative bifunctional diguanylate cyclase/phosphodiesterase [Pseudochelatococcus sp. G4_1912]|uniref:putative bifunctional diguanylate cyclase/phosphodiesterase n=1 Tax=Pseudochelatococcus sp. G4_1912 TaxID=3114288 RepID=UPI0039C67E7C